MRIVSLLSVLVSLVSVAACNRTPALAGMWDATVIAGNAHVPFRFLISGSGANLQGSFFNGDQKISSTAASIQKNAIVFSYPEYGSTLEVTAADGSLKGDYYRANGVVYTFEAQRFKPAPVPAPSPRSADSGRSRYPPASVSAPGI